MALAVIAVVLVMTTAIGLLAGAQAARGQAQAAADLAALAGASQLLRASAIESTQTGGAGNGGAPAAGRACEVAREAARRNGADVTACAGEPGAVLCVTTSRRSVAGLALATARAGPASARPAAAAARRSR